MCRYWFLILTIQYDAILQLLFPCFAFHFILVVCIVFKPFSLVLCIYDQFITISRRSLKVLACFLWIQSSILSLRVRTQFFRKSLKTAQKYTLTWISNELLSFRKTTLCVSCPYNDNYYYYYYYFHYTLQLYIWTVNNTDLETSKSPLKKIQSAWDFYKI